MICQEHRFVSVMDAAYDDLVRAYSSRVFGVCLGMLGNRHDAENMAQQMLL